MTPDFVIEELFALRINPSDLSNIERPPGTGPATGGGQLYIQVGQQMVEHLLRFLRQLDPGPIDLTVASVGRPELRDVVQFDNKSQGRMRIRNQNRHRTGRVPAWSPANGFPSLPEEAASTADARRLITSLGGLHVFLARVADGTVWAGYTVGTLDDRGGELPFAPLLSGDAEGGYWAYAETGGPS